MIRFVIPDIHGSAADEQACAAVAADMKLMQPEEVVQMGDYVDVSGIFSSHQNGYVQDLGYSYEDDCAAAKRIFKRFVDASPNASWHVLEGNHDQHLERWASRTFASQKDANRLVKAFAPEVLCGFKEFGFRYYRRSEFYHGLNTRGVFRLGKCLYVHGNHHGQHATDAHLAEFNYNVVHGHTHRAKSSIKRTVATGEIGAWCPGTLSELAPLYRHTSCTTWSHGYLIQFVSKSGLFLPLPVPIVRGKSMLKALLETMKRAA